MGGESYSLVGSLENTTSNRQGYEESPQERQAGCEKQGITNMETKLKNGNRLYRECKATSCGRFEIRFLASNADLDELIRVAEHMDSVVSRILSCGVSVDLGTPDLQTRIKNVCAEIKDYPVSPVKE